MRWRVQHCSSLWVALAHALLFQRKGFYSKREQRARARKLQQQLMHYICDWQRNHFRTHGFVPGQGGAPTIEAYCWSLKTQGHGFKSDCHLELQAYSDLFEVRVVCYDASTNRPDWKRQPWRSTAPAAAPTVRLMRRSEHEWCALYPAAAPLRTPALGRSEAGAFGTCRRSGQCPASWECTQRMCVPAGQKPPVLPPL